MNIIVRNWRPLQSGALRGFVDLEILDLSLIIKGCKVFQGKEGRSWVNFPERTYEKDGEKKYDPYLYFSSKEVKEEFRKSSLEAMRTYLLNEKNNQNAPPANRDQDDIPF